MRRNLIIFVLALVALVGLFFVLVFQPQSTRIREASERADSQEKRVEILKIELSKRQGLEARAPELREEAARFDAALPADPRPAEFILLVQEASDKSGLDWLSVTLTPAAPGVVPNTADVAVQMNLTGGYFQVQDFLVRLENLPRAVKISAINLGPGPDEGSTALSTSLTMKVFVSAPQPAAAAVEGEAGSPDGGTQPEQNV